MIELKLVNELLTVTCETCYSQLIGSMLLAMRALIGIAQLKHYVN